MKQEKKEIICCLCGKPCENEYGNNPEPLAKYPARCCDKCNYEKVVPARIKEINDEEQKEVC